MTQSRPVEFPEVSVVVIFLNEGRFLPEAVDSVFAQTYGSWELLLVDDGSTDASSSIACRIAELHPGRVRYLEHDGHANRGTSSSRNLGIRHARGKFVAFLDADDVWFPRKLERQLAVIDSRSDVGMVYGTTQLWYSWTSDPLDAGRDLTPDLGVETDRPLGGPAFLARMLRRQVLAPGICSLLVRREVIRAVGGFEEAFRGMYDDQAFIAKVCLSTSILASGECWDRYRQHSDSCYSIAKATGEDQPARGFFLEWLKTYLLARKVDEPNLREALQRELNFVQSSGGSGGAAVARRLIRTLLPGSARRWLQSKWSREEYLPRLGRVDFRSLRRLTPISRRWGKDRGGQPIDRYYIERFLGAHAADIHGRVMEIGDDTYTRRFGADAVNRRDILHCVQGNPRATIVADLARGGDQLPSAAFDCVILTQVLHLLSDPGAAVQTVYRILRPGGVVLATVPGISQISRWDMERWGDCWRFTTLSARRLFAPLFSPEQVSVAPHGNVLAATAFLQGLAAEDLRPDELDYHDPDYQVLTTVRAAKPA